MLPRIGVLLALATLPLAGAEPQQDVMLHAYPDDGVFHYAPAQVEVLPNATIVLGHLFGTHSLTSVDGLFNETGNASRWPSIRAPLAPGTYRFYCWIHATATTTPEAGMAGSFVVVQAAPAQVVGQQAPGLPALTGLAILAIAVLARRTS